MQAYLAVSKVLKTINGWTLKLSQWVVFMLACFIFYDVGMRYLVNQPTAWVLEVSEYLLVLIAFLGVATVQSQNKHIKMDFFYHKLLSRTRLYYDALFNILMLIFDFVVLWFSIKMTYSAYLYDSFSNSLLETPLFIPYSIVPIGILLLFLQNLVDLWGIYYKFLKFENWQLEVRS